MSRSHIVMRKIRDVLRSTIGEGLSLRQVGASLHIPATTAGDYVRRARNAGLTWPLLDDLDDDALESVLFGSSDPAPPRIRPMPDWAKIHLELRRPHVTRLLLWHEYKEAFPDGLGYSQFCEHYKNFASKVDVVMRQKHKAGERLFVDFSGGKVPIYNNSRTELVPNDSGVQGLTGFDHSCIVFQLQRFPWAVCSCILAVLQ